MCLVRVAADVLTVCRYTWVEGWEEGRRACHPYPSTDSRPGHVLVSPLKFTAMG